MEKYLKLKENNKKLNCLKIRIYYNKGGYNLFTYREEKRGYYLSVSPIERRITNGIVSESYGAFSGYKYLIKEVARKSAKAEQEAITDGLEMVASIAQYVAQQNDVEIEEGEI